MRVSRLNLSPTTAAVRLDPFGSRRRRTGHRQVENRDWLSRLSARAHGNDLVTEGDIDLNDRHFQPEHICHERQGEIFVDHVEEPNCLLRFVVGIDCRLLDQVIDVFGG